MIAIVAGCLVSSVVAYFLARFRFQATARRLAPWQIDPNQRCPGCGHADGSIKFSEELRNILHTCAICQATWGEETVVKVSDWRKGRPPQESPTAWP